MKAIPVIAAYESWKLISDNESGAMTRWIRREAIRIEHALRKRPVMSAVSPRRMNRNARTIEGPAPTANVYMPHADIVMTERKRRAEGELPIKEESLTIIPYIIPRCSPDNARIWEAPLSLKASVILGGMSVLSPMIRAFIIAFVTGLLKLTASMALPIAAPEDSSDCMKAPPGSFPKEIISEEMPQRTPQAMRQSPVITLICAGLKR